MVVHLVFVLLSFLVILMAGWILPPPSSLCTLANTRTTPGASLSPLSTNPSMLFRHVRVLCNGQSVEDIDNYNRVCHMFDVFQSSNKRSNNDVEGFSSLREGKSVVVGFSLCSGSGQFLPGSDTQVLHLLLPRNTCI